MDQLIGVITRAIEPDSWEEVGGPGSIIAYQGVLTISQTIGPTHKIDQLLASVATRNQTRPADPRFPFPKNQLETPAHGTWPAVFQMAEALLRGAVTNGRIALIRTQPVPPSDLLSTVTRHNALD